MRAHPRRLTNLEVSLHTADPGTPADRRDTGSLKKRITLPYWRHDRRRIGGIIGGLIFPEGPGHRPRRRQDLQAAVAQFKNELPPAPSEVISSGASANRRVAFSGTAGIKTGSGLRIDKHRLDRARSGNFRRHAQYPQYLACSRPVATQLEDYSGSCVPAGRCRPKH